MEEEEHEVYGGDIPDVGEDVDMATADDDAVKVKYLFIYLSISFLPISG